MNGSVERLLDAGVEPEIIADACEDAGEHDMAEMLRVSPVTPMVIFAGWGFYGSGSGSGDGYGDGYGSM